MELRQPANLVAPRAVWLWTVQYGLVGLLLLVVAIVLTLVGVLTGALGAIAIVVTALILLIGVLVVPRWRFRVHRWEVSDAAVFTQTGWLTQERRIAPLSRVQTVDTERGPVEQLFGLSTVTVTTASAKGALKIEGLDRSTADTMVAELTAQTGRTGGDPADDAT